jgi:Arc/MetJ family transcription regulator
MPSRSTVPVADDPGGERNVRRTRTTITLDDELMRKAQTYTGVKEKTALIREALTQLVQREAARRLGALGGTMPDLQRIPRRKMPRK